VRRVFHKLRSLTMEHVNEHVTGIVDGQGPVPPTGLVATRRFAVGAILVYHLALLDRAKQGRDLTGGLEEGVEAA
jgi:hypothetical protein